MRRVHLKIVKGRGKKKQQQINISTNVRLAHQSQHFFLAGRWPYHNEIGFVAAASNVIGNVIKIVLRVASQEKLGSQQVSIYWYKKDSSECRGTKGE